MPEYTLEQILKLYKKLPEELKDALGADETSNTIERVSEKYELSDEQISKLVELVRNVLMGLSPPDEFQKTLEEELKLRPEIAKKVSFEIHRFIFYPVRESLSALYQMEIVPPGVPRKPIAKVPEKKPERKDIYREPIE